MGLENRDYYRQASAYRGDGSWGLDYLTPVVKYIILANVAVFLLQIFVVRTVAPLEWMRKLNPEIDKLLTAKEDQDPDALEALKKKHPQLADDLADQLADGFSAFTPKISIVQEWFELDTAKVIHQGQIWRVLTHAFCHDRYAIYHIVINMLLLYWFGTTIEAMYGPREFLLFYLTGAVVAGLAFIGLDLQTGSRIPGIGASGAVMAVMMLYTIHFPYETIRVFWFFPLEMRWLMLGYVIFELHPILLALAGDRIFTGIAHSAHLGGLAFGFLYARFEWRLDPLLDWISRPRRPSWSRRRRPRLHVAPSPVSPPEPEPSADMARVDALLQKISATGQASLTDEERELLRTASERLRNKTWRGD